MSSALISRSPDLKRLRDDGYDIEIRSGHLLLKDVPYVNGNREIKRGILVSQLTMAADVTIQPETHVVHFQGDQPCHNDGTEIAPLKNEVADKDLAKDIRINRTFSCKPPAGYRDYYEKMTAYVNIISGPAESIDREATAKTYPAIEASAEESVFKYIDTASSRAGITAVTSKLELQKIAIVGLGGTGSYVLDFVAKTPVKEIHLFDRDRFLNHNAFRSPGAPSLQELQENLQKTAFLKAQYSKMRRGIFEHDFFIDASTVIELKTMSFVFLCLDKGGVKKTVAEKLEEWNIPFIDVGMGLQLVDGALMGILRVTASTADKRDHFRDRVSFSDGEENDAYSQNIQIAELNALNASLAVIKWKKLFGFYQDLEKEHFTAYTINVNMLSSIDLP